MGWSPTPNFLCYERTAGNFIEPTIDPTFQPYLGVIFSYIAGFQYFKFLLLDQSQFNITDTTDLLILYLSRERYDDMIQGLEKKQESVAMKLSALQQDYQQSLIKAGVIR